MAFIGRIADDALLNTYAQDCPLKNAGSSIITVAQQLGHKNGTYAVTHVKRHVQHQE